ncbi:hypothetical protein [Deinococcus hopiensis]|uniref:hypothetical protein n=1 Tax=Deinococcus hopiensis TaxID=309885 RepID=UPI001BB0C902|nr:hypothetical protein [Deinococcus hopiensis]
MIRHPNQLVEYRKVLGLPPLPEMFVLVEDVLEKSLSSDNHGALMSLISLEKLS